MKRPQLSELTLDEKISQLLLLRQGHLTNIVDGDPREKTKEQREELMRTNHFTGLWSYGRVKMETANLAEEGGKVSAAEQKALIDEANANVKIPLLVGVDCENGAGYSFGGGTKIGTLAMIGAANDEELTYKLNAAVAREIKASGANWRWSPIVDTRGRFDPGTLRAFSDNPEKIIKLATAAMRGTESEGVAATIKHFPGKDIYNFRDSHLATTDLTYTLEEWEQGQGRIFQALIDAGASTMMSTHIAFPAVDDEMRNGMYVPSTLSKKILQGLLRDKMGFDGVLVTDAIVMAGLTSYCSYEEILIRSINAGHDVILGVAPDDFYTVRQAVLDGRIPMERVDESCERVLKLKEKLGLFNEEQEEIDIVEQAKITSELNRKVAEKSITLLYDHNDLLPVSKEKVHSVAIVAASHSNVFFEDLCVMKEEFEQRGAKTDIYAQPFEGGAKTLRRIEKEYDLIIYAAYVAMHQPLGMPSLYGEQAGLFFSAFRNGTEKTIGVSMGYPYLHFDMMTGARTFINTYSPSPESQKAFVKAIYGEIPFEGVSPFDIEPKLRLIYC
ncbi:MAG: hypothetical protein IKU15_09455 [Clostridia bacterium]|nr:hypothetical protein [Clostridia bacterium]